MLGLSLLLGLALAPLASLAKDPEVTVTRVENVPNRLFYFDDTPVSAGLSPGTVESIDQPDFIGNPDSRSFCPYHTSFRGRRENMESGDRSGRCHPINLSST